MTTALQRITVARPAGLRDLPRQVRQLLAWRGLLLALVARDLKARYKHSVIGFFWSLLNPLLMMTIFTIVFQVLWANNTIPLYPLFVLTGLLPWNWCAGVITAGVGSIVHNGHLITKVAFPREVLPLAVVIAHGVNFLLALIPLFALLVLFGAPFTPALLLLPGVVLVQALFLGGLVLFLAALNVFFRDTAVIVEVLLLGWFFLTPVFYRVEDLTRTAARVLYIVNPMASLLACYRQIFLHGVVPAPDFLARTAVECGLIFLGGYLFFLRLAPRFAEEV
jgi:ABC-type polysaccharide/polyol phosphate export permease